MNILMHQSLILSLDRTESFKKLSLLNTIIFTLLAIEKTEDVIQFSLGNVFDPFFKVVVTPEPKIKLYQIVKPGLIQQLPLLTAYL